MFTYLEKRHNSLPCRILSAFIAFTFIFSLVLPPGYAQMIPASPAGGPQTLLNLPAPGTMVTPTAGFIPPRLIGVTIHADNPLKFDFIVNTGDADLVPETLKEESRKLIKYFLASLTVPEDELWVNLSPYEKDRMIPQGLGDTEMGRDMLAQDYLLKQLTASLMYPEKELGQKFWEKIYKQAREKYGTTQIPVNTFNKVWVVPQEAVVYEKDTSAYVVKSRLRVMLDSDYQAMNKGVGTGLKPVPTDHDLSVSTEIIREVILPAIEKEVNEGENFAKLRQMYHSLILAAWYKLKLKDGLLGKIYVDQNKTKGIDTEDVTVNRKIYDQYIESFKKGVYNYIKEDVDPQTQDVIPRKYFSGGIEFNTFVNDKVKGLGSKLLALVLATMVSEASIQSAQAADLMSEIENGKNNRIEVVLGENPKESAELILAAMEPSAAVATGASAGSEAAKLGGDLRAPAWDTQKGAAQELYRRNDKEGIELARELLVWPRIKNMTGVRQWGKPYGSGEEGNELIELGEIAEEPLIENLRNKESEINTRKWSAHLLGIIGRFDTVFPVLHGILDSQKDYLSYMPSDHYNALKIETLNGIRKLFDRQPLNDLLTVLREEKNLDVTQWVLSSLGNFPDEKAIKALIPFFNQPGEYVAYSVLDSVNRILTKNAEFVSLIPVEEVVKSMYFEGSTVAHLVQGEAVELLVAVVRVTKDEEIVKRLIERLTGSDIHPGLKFDIELSLKKLANSGSKEAIQYLKKKSGEWNTVDIKKLYQWIKSQIHPKTGLVKSFPTVPEQDASYGVTWMYNQAQSIQDALAVGDLATAEQLVRSALKLKRNKGAWYSGYITDSGEVATRIKEQGVSWTGPNMALGHGLLNVLERTTDQQLAEEIVNVALGLTGWVEGYYFDKGKYAYVSGGEGLDEVWTEHNERVFAFYYQLYNQFNNPRHKNKIVLEKYKNNADVQEFKLRADKIIRWIQTDKKEGGMWAGDHYLVGYKDLEGKELIPEITTAFPKDHPDYWKRHAWGYPQYLGPIMASIAGLNPKDFAGGMDWLLAHLSQIEINGKMFKGVPRWLGTPSIWAKGTSETVVALQLLRRENEVKMFLPTLAALQTENGGILAAVGDPGYGWPIHFPYESYEGISGVLVGVGQFGPEFIADLELVKPPSDVQRNNVIVQRGDLNFISASSPVTIQQRLIGAITALSLLWGMSIPAADALEMSLWKKFDEPTERARMINEIVLGIINLGDEQTGLAPSHVGHPGFEKLKFVYDAAVDALVLKAAGKQKEAEKILDYFADRLAIPLQEVAPYADTNGIAGILKVWKTDEFNVRGLINALDRTSTKPRGQGMLEYYSTPGPMAFIVMAFLNVNKERYLPVAVELGNALLSLQRPDGGLKDGDRSPNRVHIEPHMDAFSTFLQLYKTTNDTKWKTAAEKAWQFFIKSDAYHPQDGVIWQGVWEFGTNKVFATDAYSWTMAGPGGDRMSLYELEKFTETMLAKSLTWVTLEVPDGKTKSVILVDFTDPQNPQVVEERGGFHPMGSVEWAGGVIAALQKNAVRFWEKGNPQQKEKARHYKALAEYLIANS